VPQVGLGATDAAADGVGAALGLAAGLGLPDGRGVTLGRGVAVTEGTGLGDGCGVGCGLSRPALPPRSPHSRMPTNTATIRPTQSLETRSSK
jgi:hypothetical protein